MYNSLADYSKAVIYKIYCKDKNITDIYIGHTTCFYQRYRLHKSTCNNENAKGYNIKIYKIIRKNGGWENWDMVIIEKYPCNDIYEAKERERYWIEKESSTLNVTIPNRTNKEYSQIYRIIHKEELSEKSKIYRENNKDKIKIYKEANKEKIYFQQKDWYEDNKESILEKVKQQYEENKEVKLEYQKEYATKHKEQIKSYQDEYREKNKEKLAEQKKEYREAHKEEAAKAQKAWREANKEKLKEEKAKIYQCECGNEYTFGNKHRHLQTKLHIEYQNKLNGIIEEEQDNIPKVTEEEKKQIQKIKKKEYREKNAEKIKQNRKKYNENNKEKVSEQCKKYKQENKDKVLEQTKKYTEENKEKIKQKSHEWYEKNKEKILDRMQQIFVCECGSSIQCCGKAEHYKSVKHNTYIENLIKEGNDSISL